MKHKNNIIIFVLLLLSMSASAQIQFTTGLNYESGVPSGAPSSTGSRIRVNLATGRAYIWNQAGSNWRVLAQGIDIVSGCSAPLYTPGYGQSLFAVNGCASPELYYYTGTAWVQISGAGGATYYAGEGIDITNDTISIDTVQRLSFRTDQTYSDGIGTLSWDDTDGTLQLGLKGGNVSLQIGQESVQLVKHADNTGLTNGKVVYLTGSSGSNLTVRYAQANAESTSANTFGLMTESATGGNKAFCTTFGLVRNINTSNLTEGGMVWLSKDTAGAMTAVRPTAPNHGVEIGFCVRKHATQGVIFVTIQNGYELRELHDVYAPSPANNQGLLWKSANSRWEAATVDTSNTNEGILGVATNPGADAWLRSNTSTANDIGLVGTNNTTITATASSNGGQIVIDSKAKIDTFSLSGQTLRASLLNDGVAASSVTLPIVDVVAGTNVTVSKANGVATVSATGGGGGTPAGSTGQIQFNNAGSFAASANLAWDNSAAYQLNIGAPSSPTGKLNIKGGGTTSATVNLRLTDSGNTELLKVLDNGSTNIGTGFNWDNTNGRLGIGTSSPGNDITIDKTVNGNVRMSLTNQSTGASAMCDVFVANSVGSATFQVTGTGNTILTANQARIRSSTQITNGLTFLTGAAAPISFGTQDAEGMRLAAGNNLLVGSTTDSGYKLRVNSTGATQGTFLSGPGTSSTTYSLICTNSGASTSTAALAVRDDSKVGIGTNSVDSSATLEVDGTTGGILFPRLSTTDRNALTPVNGLVIYNSTTNKLQVYASGAWVDLH